MASSDLECSAYLRTWHNAGLSFLLQEEPVCVSPMMDQPAQLSSAPPIMNSDGTQRDVATPLPQQRTAPPRPRASRTAQQPSAPQQQPQAPNQPASDGQPAIPSFPAPWDGFCRFVKPQADFLWTYWHLGMDLGGQPNDGRRNALKWLVSNLAPYQERTTFWPVAALQGSMLIPSTDLFWQGVRWIKPRGIVCYGSAALTVLSPEIPYAETMVSVNGVKILVVPELSQIVSRTPEGQAAWSRAHAALMRFASI